MRNIRKDIPYTVIHCQRLSVENGAVTTSPLEPFTVRGKHSLAKCEKLARKEHKGNVIVVETETYTNIYFMTIDDFIKNATLVNSRKND